LFQTIAKIALAKTATTFQPMKKSGSKLSNELRSETQMHLTSPCREERSGNVIAREVNA
jgi:hypothetical protein